MPTLAQVYEDHAADCTRAEMLLTLALQWRLAAREEAATQSQPKMTDRAREMPASCKLSSDITQL